MKFLVVALLCTLTVVNAVSLQFTDLVGWQISTFTNPSGKENWFSLVSFGNHLYAVDKFSSSTNVQQLTKIPLTGADQGLPFHVKDLVGIPAQITFHQDLTVTNHGKVYSSNGYDVDLSTGTVVRNAFTAHTQNDGKRVGIASDPRPGHSTIYFTAEDGIHIVRDVDSSNSNVIVPAFWASVTDGANAISVGVTGKVYVISGSAPSQIWEFPADARDYDKDCVSCPAKRLPTYQYNVALMCSSATGVVPTADAQSAIVTCSNGNLLQIGLTSSNRVTQVVGHVGVEDVDHFDSAYLHFPEVGTDGCLYGLAKSNKDNDQDIAIYKMTPCVFVSAGTHTAHCPHCPKVQTKSICKQSRENYVTTYTASATSGSQSNCVTLGLQEDALVPPCDGHEDDSNENNNNGYHHINNIHQDGISP